MGSEKYSLEQLKRGSDTQKGAVRAIENLGIPEILAEYSPLLAGTFPIGIDIPGSDLDIICEVHDFAAFRKLLVNKFGQLGDFRISPAETAPPVTANFYSGGFDFEIYGENRPVREQNAYRHMVIEDRLLQLGGETLRRKIIDLKLNSLKTEPAFAKLLSLAGNPFDALLELEGCSDEVLREMLGKG